MSSALFWAYAVMFFGAAGAGMYLYLTWQARHRVKFTSLVLGLLIAGTCAYPAVLWGGQTLGWWVVTPEYGRPALGLTLVALVCLGLLAYAPVERR